MDTSQLNTRMSQFEPPSSSLPSRASVLSAFREMVREELDALERVSAVTREEVTSDETRSEGKYDTRSTEASYLARGQAWRIASLRQLAAWINALPNTPPQSAVACIGSLVALEGEEIEYMLLGPVGGSKIDGCVVRLISPDSPVGSKVVGLQPGDDFEVKRPSGRAEFSVIEIG